MHLTAKTCQKFTQKLDLALEKTESVGKLLHSEIKAGNLVPRKENI